MAAALTAGSRYNGEVMSLASPLPSLRRQVVQLTAGVLCLLALIGCQRAPSAAVNLPLNPPWWQPAVPFSHHTLSAVLAGGFPLPGEDLDERRRGYLREYLAVLAEGGPISTPELFPDQAHVIAYYLNAHVAWSHALGSAPQLKRASAGRLQRERIRLDRTTTTLAEIAEAARGAAAGEPRVELFLNPGWRYGPRLPPSAVEGYSLSWQLTAQAQRCGASPGFWTFDTTAREIRHSALVESMQGLPATPRLRVRKALDLVPPPPELRTTILTTCGEQLQRCTVRSAPLDRTRV